MNIDLNKYIPNKLVSAPGEITLGDKLSPFIESAKQWFEKWFCNLSLIEDKESLLDTACKIIVREAYCNAVPQFDLVLTANGFATVDSKMVVPASKARTDRLLEGLIKERDKNIDILLFHLRKDVDEWIKTPQASFFRQTLICSPELADNVRVPQSISEVKSKWERYLKMIPLIKNLEDDLADDWFSPELMEALREGNQSYKLTGVRFNVFSKIRNVIVWYFEYDDLRTKSLQAIVNIIRYDEENFPEWHNSETAKHFSPPKFENKKKSTGYFF